MSEKSTKETSSTILNRLRILLATDAYRVPLQTTAGVLLAFGATYFMGRENMSWGVFSALFVVQASIGGTVSSGLERIAGAVLGAVVGVVAVLLPGDGLPGTLLSLVVGVSTMSLLAARWPKLAYGLVTVTIIIVAPDLYVVEGALEKIVAIGIGSACGMLAAVAVFPVSARRRSEHYISEALRACGRLLEEFVQRMVDGESDDHASADADIAYALSRAREMSRQAQAERAPMARPDASRFELLAEVERFRYTLTLIDRFGDDALPECLQWQQRHGLYALCDAARQQVERLADAIVARASCEPVAEVSACFDRFSKGVDEAVVHRSLGQADRERLIAVKGAYAAMLQNLIRLCDRVSRQYQA